MVRPALVPAPLHVDRLDGHAGHYHLDPALLAAVIEAESKFNTDARSQCGRRRPDAADTETAEGIVRTRAATTTASPSDEP